MKRGVLVLILLLLTSCTYSETNKNNNYPKINLDDFVEKLIDQNTQFRNNITALNRKLSDQQEEINILDERLEIFYELPDTKEGPYDWIKGENIKVLDDKIIIELQNASIANIADTHSLEPLIHKNTNVIEIYPESPSNIHLGDIVAYHSIFSNGTILHRVVLIDEDEIGWYAIMKGDNNPRADPGRIRFEQIQRVVVGIIY